MAQPRRVSAASELRRRRRLLESQESADGERVKAASRVSGGAKAPALTRSTAADTIKTSNSTLTANTVAEERPQGRVSKDGP